jgi:transposase
MRKVILTMNENQKYEIIKKLVDTNGNKKAATLKIGCSDRHVNRLIKGYREKGKALFIHGNRGRQPATTLPSDTKQVILDLYRTKFYDCNLTHYAELLNEKEHICVSVSTLASTLRKEYILSLRPTVLLKRP